MLKTNIYLQICSQYLTPLNDPTDNILTTKFLILSYALQYSQDF